MTETAYSHDLRHERSELRAALADAAPHSFWFDSAPPPPKRPPLGNSRETDLLIVGGGYCGLWTAIMAKERDPDRDVVLIEARRIGWAASGRNGGFCEASLTHGPENGELHFADQLEELDGFASENFEGLAAALERYGIDAEFERSGVLTVATEPHQVEGLREAERAGHLTVLAGAALREVGNSPLYRAGFLEREGAALVNPAKLVWGLAEAAEHLGVIIHEETPATGLSVARESLTVRTASGDIRAKRVALATNGFPSLLRRLRLFTVPIYDYALMTESLTEEQLASIGWTGRHGITDSSREFHYYRKSADNRILFGGYDAVYHRGRRIRAEHDQRPETFERLADHFFSTFPQLRGVRFTHKWGGMIDMSTQLVAFHGSVHGGRVAFSSGYTGLGVAATRFGADVMLDFLEGRDTPRTRLKMSRRLPIPIPPEPLAYPLIQMMRRAVAKSDADGGKEGFLLRLAGALGVGFDS